MRTQTLAGNAFKSTFYFSRDIATAILLYNFSFCIQPWDNRNLRFNSLAAEAIERRDVACILVAVGFSQWRDFLFRYDDTTFPLALNSYTCIQDTMQGTPRYLRAGFIPS